MSKPVIDPELAALVAQAVAPAELSQAERAAMHARILARIGAPPPPLTETIRAGAMRWVNAGPGVEVMVLRSSDERNDQTVLIRMQPGSVVVGHRHTQEEECWILEGEVFIGEHRLMRGDMHVAYPGAVHEPITAPQGALVLIRSERPPRHFKIA
jgi:anti-sigma factor ChrR (cupin superfamily)